MVYIINIDKTNFERSRLTNRENINFEVMFIITNTEIVNNRIDVFLILNL